MAWNGTHGKCQVGPERVSDSGEYNEPYLFTDGGRALATVRVGRGDTEANANTLASGWNLLWSLCGRAGDPNTLAHELPKVIAAAIRADYYKSNGVVDGDDGMAELHCALVAAGLVRE